MDFEVHKYPSAVPQCWGSIDHTHRKNEAQPGLGLVFPQRHTSFPAQVTVNARSRVKGEVIGVVGKSHHPW
jgi:hypothetical protein